MPGVPVRTPRDFPTVAHDRLPGASGVSPMVTCAPLTAKTRPNASRGARAGAAIDAAGGFTRVILIRWWQSKDAPKGPMGNYIRTDLGVSVKPELALGDKPAINRGSC